MVHLAVLVPQPARATDAAHDHIDPATGYRIERYQAAVPEKPPAGERVHVADIDRLLAEGDVILIDVSPITGLGYDPATGAWRNNKPHRTLPGAVWLPEVGRGRPGATVEAFFATELGRLTGGDKNRAVVLFCYADCWMSWNAMKRAGDLGYTRLYWFAEGTDGWRDWDRKLVPATPLPIPANLLGTRP